MAALMARRSVVAFRPPQFMPRVSGFHTTGAISFTKMKMKPGFSYLAWAKGVQLDITPPGTVAAGVRQLVAVMENHNDVESVSCFQGAKEAEDAGVVMKNVMAEFGTYLDPTSAPQRSIMEADFFDCGTLKNAADWQHVVYSRTVLPLAPGGADCLKTWLKENPAKATEMLKDAGIHFECVAFPDDSTMYAWVAWTDMEARAAFLPKLAQIYEEIGVTKYINGEPDRATAEHGMIRLAK